MAGGNDQRYNITIGANMDPSGVLGAVKQMQGAFNGLKLPANMTGDVLKNFNKLTESLSKFEKIASQDHFSKADIKSLQKLQKEINSTFGSLRDSFSDLSGQKFYLEADYTKIKEARQVVSDLKAEIQSKLSDIKIDFSAAKGGTASLGLDTLLSRMEQGVKTSKTLSAAMAEISNSIQMGDLSSAGEQFTQMITKAKNLKGASAELLDTFKQWGLVDFSGQAKNIESMNERARLLAQVFEKLFPIFSQNGEKIGELSEKAKNAVNNVLQLEQIGTENFNNSLSTSIDKTEQLGEAARQTSQSTIEMADGMRRASDEVKQLQQSTQYFFSLRNMLNLLKRGLREAVETVKSLDKAMTETAVVTKFSVGDMWAKLPEYTANANALGATVQDMYEATTLYYQQGLESQQAMEIATETMKMARIAGLEAKDATDMMTAALRGFNMELNETSAIRINDVYSNLAAKTASDTKEIGTAMQRTASIAHSAGMSFEGTAAFLAQAIETTREPAENLGTAMKTIVARFTELKKNPLEIAEVDGEEVSYNKVDTALQSIGVSLKDTNGQFRDLDQVFLDISQKWDSLTQTQQRYIATTAAGSRQQSRFIAMMSNYERTMQLMDYANNSAGASTVQFNKTLESLEAKINKFQNAWKEFLMGIMNDKWTKKIVDTGTTVLNIINKILDTITLNGKLGLLKSALSIFTAFTALKFTGRSVNALVGGLGGMIDPKSNFRAGAQTGVLGRNSAQAINQPIVKELQSIRSLLAQKINQSSLGRQSIIGPYDEYSKFKSARTAINQINGTGNVNNLTKQLLGLSANSQNTLMRGYSATFQAATEAIISGYDSKYIVDITKGSKFLNNQRKSAEITARGYYTALRDPGLLKQAMIKAGVDKHNPVFQYMNELDTQADTATKALVSRAQGKFEGAIAKARAEGKTINEDAYKRGQQYYNSDKAYSYFRDKYLKEDNPTYQTSKTGLMVQKLGQFGTYISQAGMGLQAFGGILTQSANPALQLFGTTLTSIGGLISGLGMGISGLSSGFTAVAGSAFMKSTSAAISGLTGLTVTASTLTGVFAGVALAAGILVTLIKKHNDKIKKAGEELSKNYNDKKTETNSNISNLEGMRAEFALLSKGVDKYGNNIGLDTSDFNRYKEIVAEIATINPSIVEGYNAQGDAIVSNNQALEETLALQKQIQKENVRNYTSSTSLQTLIDSRNLDENYLTYGAWGQSARTIDAPAQKYFKQLKRYISDDTLRSWGLDPTKTGAQQAELLSRNIDKIQARVDALDFDEDIANKIYDKATDLKTAAAAFDESITPIYESLSEFATLNKLNKTIPAEMQTAFQAGLKDIAGQGLSGIEMQDAARDLAKQFNAIFTRSEYKDALKALDEATKQYAQDMDANAYLTKVNTGEFHDNLTALITDLENDGTEVSRIAAEHLRTLISNAQNIKNVVTSVSDAFDTMATHIDIVKQAAENFSDSVEGLDPNSGAKSLKSIYDIMYDENSTHAQLHDAVWWKGAEQFVSADMFKKGTIKEIDTLMSNLAPALEDGIDGVRAARNFLLENADGKFIKNDNGVLDVKITNDQELTEAAAQYGMNPEAFAAVLKRLGPVGIDFSDYEALREIYATGENHLTEERALQGTNDKLGILISEEQALNDALANGKTPEEFYKTGGVRDKLEEQGINLLPAFEKGNEKNNQQIQSLLEQYGVTANNYLEKLTALNLEKDEIKSILDAGLIQGADSSNLEQEYADFLANEDDSYENESLNTLNRIQDTVSQIASKYLGKDYDESGITTGKASKSDFLSKDFASVITDTDGPLQHFLRGETANGEKIEPGHLKEVQKDLEESLLKPLQNYKKEVEQGQKEAETYAKQHPEDTQAQTKIQQYNEELGKINSLINLTDKTIHPSLDQSDPAALLPKIDPQVAAKHQANLKNIINDILSGAIPTDEDLKALGIADLYQPQKNPTSTNNEDSIRAGLKELIADEAAKGTPGGRHINTAGVLDSIINFFTGNKSQNWQYGNVSKANRPQGLTDDYGNTITVLGGSKSFDIGNGIEKEIAFTPVVKLNGEGTILEDDTVDAYINALITQLQSEGKEVNLENLLTLDSTGTVEGFEGINNVIADVGENAAVTAIQMHALEAGLDVTTINAQYQALSNTIKKVGDEADAAGAKGEKTTSDNLKSSTDVQATTYEVFTAGAEGNITALTDKLQYLKDNYPEVHSELIAEFPQYGQLETYSEEIQKLDNKEVQQTITASVANQGTLTGLSEGLTSLSNKNPNIKVAVDEGTSASQLKKLDKEANKLDDTKNLKINVQKTGVSSITVDGHTWTISTKSGAKGINNTIIPTSLPTFGSLAKGTKSRYGQVGPNNRGGLTLTGETGFEIAWIPDENRSMILGAHGPQMLNLPNNAVVWTHEQSKKILSQKAIPAGSHNAEGRVDDFGGSGGGKGKKKKKSKKKSKKSKKKDITPTINNWSFEEAVRYNIDQSLASITEEISLRTKEIEKNLEKIGTTYSDIVGSTQAQIAALDQVKQKNKELLESNQRQLADYRAQQQYVSWTDANGESQRTLINIASYLNADGSINTGAIAGLNNRALEEAVYKEISSIKGVVDGINNANKAIQDADEKIAELGKKISEAFYQWENELTEVYSLTQRINNEVSFTNRFTSQVELELSKLNAGFGDTAKSIANARNVLTRNNATIQAQIKNQQQMIAARQRELEAALSYEDEVNKLNQFKNQTGIDDATKAANIEWAQNLAEGARLGSKYVKNLFKDIDGSIQYSVDWEQFNADNAADPYSKTTYEAIKKYLDDLNSAATDFNDSIKEQTDFIKQTYDALREYQDYISDMEDTLIKGVEEEIEEAKNNAKQLSDSITGALKDLLDEVKRKLDERRKQEDNAKTERDISQKQQRLAALRADTAGGHQVEIAQLEKEIADSQQSYQRTLEDQLLDRLQQQADEAAQQRERQIELAETGNQIAAANNKELVDMWLRDPETYKEQIRNAWLEANGYDEKGEAGQYVLENQFESDFAQLVTAVEQTNFTDHFNALTADTNSLLYTLEQLTNGQLGREDELAHSTNALLDVTDRNTTSILTEMQKQNSAAMLKAKGADAATLKTLGYGAKDMLEGGYTPEELKEAGYTAKELAEGGINSVSALKNIGYSAANIKDANVGNASDFKEAGYTAQDLKDIFNLDELVDALYDAKALKDAGYDASTLKGAGFGIQQLKNAGYSLPQLKVPFSAAEFGAGGMTYAEAKAAGYGLNDLKTVSQYAAQAQQEQKAIDAENARIARVNAYNSAIAAAHRAKTVNKSTLVDAINKGAAAGVSASRVGYDLASGDGSGGVTWEEVVKAAKKAGYSKATVKSWWNGYGGYATKAINKWSKFATGGLADYTGPAWLDGTPSKPELVLNPTDTKNFLALRDVLSSAMKSTGAVNNSYGGDATYEININVDHLNNDYDVDKVAERVKKIIVKDAGYRNVTQVRNLR